MFLMLFAGLCFSQSAGKGPKAPSKPGAKAPAAAAKAPAAKAPPKYAGPEEIPAARPDDIFPPVVAKVNGEPILGRDLEQLVRSELNAIGNPEWKNLRGDYRAELTLNKITLLINSKLLYQKAMAGGQWATDGEVQSEIQKIARSYKSEAEMNADLAGQNRTRASLEKSLFENLTTSKYVEATINKKIVVTPEEAAKYYKSNLDNFRHPDVVRTGLILIKPADGTPEQDAAARQRAESLLCQTCPGIFCAHLGFPGGRYRLQFQRRHDSGIGGCGLLTPGGERQTDTNPAGLLHPQNNGQEKGGAFHP